MPLYLARFFTLLLYSALSLEELSYSIQYNIPHGTVIKSSWWWKWILWSLGNLLTPSVPLCPNGPHLKPSKQTSGALSSSLLLFLSLSPYVRGDGPDFACLWTRVNDVIRADVLTDLFNKVKRTLFLSHNRCTDLLPTGLYIYTNI